MLLKRRTRTITCMLTFIVLIIFTTWNYKSTITSTRDEFDIPNDVYYVLFNRTKLDFITYLSILSVLKVQKPETIQIYTDKKWLSGHYWQLINNMITNTTIKLNHIERPTHIYGQKLSSIYHSSDVTRISLLKTYGGIYLDTDVLVLNNMDDLRKGYQMVVGCPDDEAIGTQVLIGKKDALFLNMWLKGYQKYQPRDWYYNAGRYPLTLIKHYPEMAHCIRKEFGVENLLDKLYNRTYKWKNWNHYYTVHLLYRHEPSIRDVNELTVQSLNNTFGDIVNWLLSL